MECKEGEGMNFKSQKELMEHLVKGGKVRHTKWATNDYVHLFSDNLLDASGCQYPLNFSHHTDYAPYTEPPKEEWREVVVYECVEIDTGDVRSFRRADICAGFWRRTDTPPRTVRYRV